MKRSTDWPKTWTWLDQRGRVMCFTCFWRGRRVIRHVICRNPCPKCDQPTVVLA